MIMGKFILAAGVIILLLTACACAAVTKAGKEQDDERH